MPSSRRRGPHPHAGQNRKQQRVSFLNIIEKYLHFILYVFFILWGLGLYYIQQSSLTYVKNGNGIITHQNAGDHDLRLTHQQSNSAASMRSRIEKQGGQGQKQQQINNKNNPVWYYGWQPKILPKTCSWRDCFQNDDKVDACSTCRQGRNEFGVAVPSPPNTDEIPQPPDVTVLRRMMIEGKDANGNAWPPPLNDPELCEKIGPSGGTSDVNRELFIASNITAQPLVLGIDGDNNNNGNNSLKIMCIIYTMFENHHTNVRAIRETWAGGCDGFLAFSTKTDLRIPAISIPHLGIESYHNMWQKVRSIWKYVGKHYLEDFDYFFIGGEDLYVMPQNLRSYLATLGDSSEELHFVGRRFKGYGHDNYFNSGGAGYALSRGTLRKFYNEGLDHPECNPTRTTSMEDVMVASCLRNVLNINLTDTRDSAKRERFHPFAPGTHYTWQPPGPEDSNDWYDDYNKEWGVLLGKDCCAPDSVSFHYMKKPAMVRHIHALLYYCNNNKKKKSSS